MTKLRACITGCGDIGYKFDRERRGDGALTHFRAIRDSGLFELCGAADTDEEVLNEISDRHGIPVYTDTVEMWNETKPDVITIASSDETHIPFLKKALESGPKAVFCEKPLGLRRDEVTEITALYEKVRVPIQVNYTRRFLKEFSDIGAMLKSGKLGIINSVTFYYGRGLIHNASHYIDLVLMYFGMPEEVVTLSSRSGLGETDFSYSFRLGYKGGMEVIFIALEPSRISFAEIDIVGSEGRVKLNYMNEIEKYAVTSNRSFSGYMMYELTESAPVKFEEALPAAYRNIYGAITRGEELLCPGSGSVQIFEMIKRIKEQYNV